LSELGFKVMRMRCLRGDLCAGALGTLFEYQGRILNGAMFRARAGPLQLRSSSECQRYILNASLMLHTSGCIRYTLKVACRLNVRGVLPQSRPRCVVDQPTCETVKVPIVNVLLAFTDHPTPKTLGHTFGLWTFECLFRGNVGIHRAPKAIQVDGSRPRRRSWLRFPWLSPIRNPCELWGLYRRSYFGPRTCGGGITNFIEVSRVLNQGFPFSPLNVHFCVQPPAHRCCIPFTRGRDTLRSHRCLHSSF
jgi:hypothetical protein